MHLFAERLKQILAVDSKVHSTHCEIKGKERVLTTGDGKTNLGEEGRRPAPGPSPYLPLSAAPTEGLAFTLAVPSDQGK